MAKLDVTYAYAADIVKSERDPDTGDLMVYGKATGPDLDLDGQICDPAWLGKAMPAWYEWGNVREMHGSVAAGVGVEMSGDDAGNYMVLSRCVDKGAAEKVEAKVYKGYSIGIKNARVIKDLKAPGGRIVDGEIVEISYVDRPCNPTAKMSIAKSAGLAEDGDSIEVEDGDEAGHPLLRPVEVGDIEPDTGDEVVEIIDVPDEPVAVEPVVLAEDGIGKAIGIDMLRRLRKAVPADTLTKAAGDDDIATAQEAIAVIARLIQSEANGLAAGQMCEAEQISCLLRAIDALAWFQCMEDCEPPSPAADASLPMTDDMDMNGAVVTLAVEPDQAATIKTPEAGFAQADPLRSDTASPASGTENTTDLVKTAVAEAMKAHEAEIASLRADLVKANSRPIPGGPVLARPRAVIAEAGEREQALVKAEHFESLSKQFQATDPVTARSYAELARNIRLTSKE